MGNLAKLTTKAVPSPLPRETQGWLDRKYSMIERSPAGHHSISSRHAPTTEEMKWLECRRRELLDQLRVAEPHEIAETISEMMLGFGGAARTRADAERTVALYTSQLASFPLWAVNAACVKAMRSGSEFAPTVAEVVASADKSVSIWKAEVARIALIISAEIYREPGLAERKRVADCLKRVISDLALNKPMHRQARDLASASGGDANE